MSQPSRQVIVCSLCSQEFSADWGQPACRKCPLADNCRFVRCPRCGYENPVPPAWLRMLADFGRSGEPR